MPLGLGVSHQRAKFEAEEALVGAKRTTSGPFDLEAVGTYLYSSARSSTPFHDHLLDYGNELRHIPCFIFIVYNSNAVM